MHLSLLLVASQHSPKHHLISTALISPAHSRLLRRTYCFHKRCISAGCPHSHSKQSLNAPTPAACSPQCLLSHRSIPRGSITSAQHACPRSSPPPLRTPAPRSFSRMSSCTACVTGLLASCVPLADVRAGCHDKPQRPTAEALTCVHLLQAWHSNGRPASCVALQLQRACLLRMHPPKALVPLRAKAPPPSLVTSNRLSSAGAVPSLDPSQIKPPAPS